MVKRPPRLLPQLPSHTSPDTVTFLDLRLLHHFLMVAYPHLPAGNDSIWQTQIPQIAHQHTYLMHALLGLGASHLHRVDPTPCYQASAVSHRGHAIAGLNAALNNLEPSTRADETDAMLATAYSLTFQASYMEDGLVDFITMVRGCALITEQIRTSRAATSFSLKHDAHLAHLEPDVSNPPLIDADILNAGLLSLAKVSSILNNRTDLEFFFALKRTLQACQESTREGFVEFVNIYTVWFKTTSPEFNELIRPTNDTAKVLLCYFTAIQMLMAPATMPLLQSPRRFGGTATDIMKVTFIWTRKLIESVSLRYGIYLAWPEAVVRMTEKAIDGKFTSAETDRMSNSLNDSVVTIQGDENAGDACVDA